MLVLILILILLFGGVGYRGGWYGPYNHKKYGYPGLLPIILIVVVLWLLLGGGLGPVYYPHGR